MEEPGTTPEIKEDKFEQQALGKQFLSIAAHDLRSPISVITGYCDYLLGICKDPLTDTQAQAIAVIRRTAQKMLELVNDLLDVSKIESEQMVLNPEETDLVDLTKKLVEYFRVVAVPKGIRIIWGGTSNIPVVSVDPLRVEQVLTNLLSNAVKFSFPGTSVTVKIHQENDRVIISVTDEGPGIALEDQKKVFLPFPRLSQKGTAGEKSTGLGLYISRKIMEAHGGDIGVKSEIDKGSTFYVSFPI